MPNMPIRLLEIRKRVATESVGLPPPGNALFQLLHAMKASIDAIAAAITSEDADLQGIRAQLDRHEAEIDTLNSILVPQIVSLNVDSRGAFRTVGIFGCFKVAFGDMRTLAACRNADEVLRKLQEANRGDLSVARFPVSLCEQLWQAAQGYVSAGRAPGTKAKKAKGAGK